MSNLTDLLPAGAGGKQVSFVASGTIGNGVTVGLNSDGTVTAVVSVAQTIGSPAVFESANSQWVTSTFDSNSSKVVVAYRDGGNSNYGTAVIGTVSGTSISFGTAVVFQSSLIDYTSITFDSTLNKVVIAYRNEDNFDYGTAIVGTVSGDSISFGTAVVFDAAASEHITSIFDSNSNKVVIAYRNAVGNGDSIVGTVSGTSISFGSGVIFASAQTYEPSIAFDSNSNKVVIAYKDGGNSQKGTAIVGDVSGTSISYGSEVIFESGRTDAHSVTFDSNSNKVVMSYVDEDNSNYGTSAVGTVSGTSISFGTPVVFESGTTNNISATFDSNANKIVIAYKDIGNSNYGTAVVGAVSGTSISFNTPIVFENAAVDYPSATYDSTNKKVVISYRDIGGSLYGTSIVFQNASSNNTSFIGISDAAISDTASGSVTIKGGISTNVTGLTANQNYYVQDDGTLSTTASDVLAGKALSSTSINLDYTT